MHTHNYQQTPNARRAPSRGPANSWQARAIAAYQRNQPDEATLRHELTAALHALTGQAVAGDAIIVDLTGRAATARLDGALFRWADGGLHLIRPCAHCGHGTFSSPPLRDAEELGFVLSAWRPLHEDCRPFEADDIH